MTTFRFVPSQPRYSDEWFTPPAITAELLQACGLRQFDLDPAAPIGGSMVPASRYYTIVEDGLTQPWTGGVVFVNPPYSAKEAWLAKATEEVEANRCRGVLILIPASTEAAWFHEFGLYWPRWVSRGRIDFVSPTAGGPGRNTRGSVLILMTSDWRLCERIRKGLSPDRWSFCGYPAGFRASPSMTARAPLQTANQSGSLAVCNDLVPGRDHGAAVRSGLGRVRREIAVTGSYTSRKSGRTMTRLGNPSTAPAAHLAEFSGSAAAAAAKMEKADKFALGVKPILVEILGPEPWREVSFERIAQDLERRGIPTARSGAQWHRATVKRLVDRLRQIDDRN